MIEFVADVGEMEKEHRKYGEFYAWIGYTISQEDVDWFSSKGIDAKQFLGVQVSLNGMWSDSWGCEWNDVDFSKVEYYEEFVPEVVIPAHYVTKDKLTEFKPEWE